MSLPNVPLGQVCEIIMGQAPKGETYNTNGDGLPLVGGASDFGVAFPKPKKFTSAPTKISKHGDIILSIRATIGSKVEADGQYCLGRGVAALRAKSKLDRRYLWHWLTQSTNTLLGKARGATFLQVSSDDIKSLPVPLPPLEEQRRIAAILDKADALRQKRKQATESVSQLAASIFRKMFVDEDPASWQEATIEQLSTDIRTGPFGSQLLHSEFVDEGIPVLGIDNAVDNYFKWGKSRHITPEKYKKLRRYTVLPGDVLVTIMGTCGRCAVVPYDIPTAINTKHLCCITLNQDSVLPEYVQSCFLFHNSVLSQLGVQAKGAVMPGLNMGIIKTVRIHVPPMDRQKTFVDLISKIQAQKKFFTTSADKLNTHFSSLQHRAFSGQL